MESVGDKTMSISMLLIFLQFPDVLWVTGGKADGILPPTFSRRVFGPWRADM
jgi:hypothetical protein